jgi:hypothetical protein
MAKANQKVVFDNVTPIIKEDKKLNKETQKDPRFTNELVDQIRGSEAEISGLKSTNSENTKLVNELKIDQYVGLITHVASQATPEMIREIMSDNGITSQTKLKQAVNPQDDIMLGDKIARMIYGKMKSVKNTEGVAEDKFVQTDLTADDIKIIEETLADAKRMWEAVEKANKESSKDQSEDNQQVKDTFKTLGI